MDPTLALTSSPQAQALYLRTLPAVRQQCARVFELAKENKLEYFDYHPDKETDVISFCENLIRQDYGTDFDAIPQHGRWRHLDAGQLRVDALISSWQDSAHPPDSIETCKRLIDLFLVSVLMDAGAGTDWSYHEHQSGQTFSRSEGLAVASIHMFSEGFFSASSERPCKVDAVGLSQINVEKMAEAMQVSPSNPIVGLAGRTNLLYNLGGALQSYPQYFGEDARPGNMIDFLVSEIKQKGGIRCVHVSSLWHILIEGLATIWPARTFLAGVSLGDVWPCDVLKLSSQMEGNDLVPFHKLTSWLTYSLIEPIEKILGWKFEGLEDMTGLPEYRNGGLLVDFGVLALKHDILSPSLYVDVHSRIPRLPPSHPAVVEWRAMTVIELDRIADGIRRNFGVSSTQLTLAQILESATWKGGRKIARQKRPETGGPPIEIDSDGTVF